MADWHRRQMLDLAAAVRCCQGKYTTSFRVRQRLASVVDLANLASKHVYTTAEQLNRLKTQLCRVCRSESLYECDGVEAWSETCALVAANTP